MAGRKNGTYVYTAVLTNQHGSTTTSALTVTVNKANLEAANSRITDVDVASESTQLARWNVLVQAGTSMLAQANQSAQTALRLLQ